MSEDKGDGTSSGERPLCFVLMPFGEKPDPTGGPNIDFNQIYHAAIKPGIEEAGLEPICADEETTVGIIHKPMFERLLLADFALTDMTTGNANVFYALGVRHTARPATTLTIFASHQPIPFDVNFLRSVPYELGENNHFGEEEAKALRHQVATRLQDLRNLAKDTAPADSPVFQLLGEWNPGDIARLKTDTFRDRVQFNEKLRTKIAAARRREKAVGCEELGRIEERIEFDAVETGVLVDLFLSHRALSDWAGMIGLYERFPDVLKRQILIREQLAFALNRRAGENKDPQARAKALEILKSVEAEQGPSSETCGLIGRIHKDNWGETKERDSVVAKGHLKQAIAAYTRGFQADWRDAYSGINALNLLDLSGDSTSLACKQELLPVVRYAVKQRIETKAPDYWDHATLLELAVLDNQPDQALEHLSDAAAVVREKWEPETTANNLKMIARKRKERGEDTDWLYEIIASLEAHS